MIQHGLNRLNGLKRIFYVEAIYQSLTFNKSVLSIQIRPIRVESCLFRKTS